MPATPKSAYSALEVRFRRLTLLTDVNSLLHWDSATMMPQGAVGARGEQEALVKSLAHDMLTDPALPDLLDAAEAEGLDDWQRANLRAMRRDWLHAAGVDKALVEALARACSACEMAWRGARQADDFKAVRPHLETLLALTREEAVAKGEQMGLSPYDALLDQYEPGLGAVRIDAIFDPLGAFLPSFLAAVLEAQADAKPPLALMGPFPAAKQHALGLRLAKTLGFDFLHGRLDVSLHPFCSGNPDDVRITTRYDEADFMSAVMGVLHETGHGLYERGLPEAWRYQPVGRAGGMALHESQSLIIEMQACRSKTFMHFLAPYLRATFAGDGPAWGADNLARLYTQVKRSLIRVDADEVTYPAHVILRYRLEKAMIAGDLAVADLPGAWREGMGRLLGISPKDDRDGCLQDIHWFSGAFGYFPTYTLGAIAAAQLFDAAASGVPDLMDCLGRGDFAPLLGWLRANVHNKGALLPTEDLLKQVTGRGFDVGVFQNHLIRRYLY